MAGDPTQTQPQMERSESPALQEWYVVTGGGGSAVRIMPGLTVGESESGALALNDPEVGNQWVEFVLADNGEPWATIVTRDKSLRVAGTTCLRHPLHLGATVRLPNNTLHISHDIRTPRLSETVVEVVHRDIPGRLQDLVGPELGEVLAAVREPRPATPAVEIPELADPTEPTPWMAEAPEPNRDAPDDWSDRTLTMAEPPHRMRRPESVGRRRQVAVMGGVLALGAVILAGVVAMIVSMGEGRTARLGNFDPVPAVTPPVTSPAETRVPAESPGDASALVADPLPPPAEVSDGISGADAAPSRPGSTDAAAATDHLADGRLAGASGPAPSGGAEATDSSPPAADATPPPEPAVTDQEPEQVAMLPGAEPELPAPVELPPVERRSIPPVARTDAQDAGAAEAVAAPETIDRQPNAALVAELEEIGLMAQAVAAELALRRDLLAADLALAQGRLTTPPEASAHTLYNRVLALDPGSPEATRGLQSVRDELINRALAQLAGDQLDDARRSLEAAADAGANSLLIADLRAEVDYRQRQINVETQ